MLGFNDLEGPLFNFGNLTLLTHLCVLAYSFNLLDYKTNTRLACRSLQFNALSGTIPDVFDQLTQLHRIQLQSNNFEGPIPRTLVGRSYLEL